MSSADTCRFVAFHGDGWWTVVNDEIGIVTSGRTVAKLLGNIGSGGELGHSGLEVGGRRGWPPMPHSFLAYILRRLEEE